MGCVLSQCDCIFESNCWRSQSHSPNSIIDIIQPIPCNTKKLSRVQKKSCEGAISVNLVSDKKFNKFSVIHTRGCSEGHGIRSLRSYLSSAIFIVHGEN